MIKYFCDFCLKECLEDVDMIGSKYYTFHDFDNKIMCDICYEKTIKFLEKEIINIGK